MKLLVIAVKDAAVEAFEPPMFFRARGEAIRGFQNVCQDAQTMPGKFPEHYSLHLLAEFNAETGEFTQLVPECISRALDFVTTN